MPSNNCNDGVLKRCHGNLVHKIYANYRVGINLNSFGFRLEASTQIDLAKFETCKQACT